MKKILILLVFGMASLSISCEKEPFLEYELPNLGNSLEFDAKGGSASVEITADCSYEIACEDNWISIKKVAYGIKVEVDANTNTESRETEIKLLYSSQKEQLCKLIKVTQKAFEPTLSLSKSELNFSASGGSQDVFVTANAEFRISQLPSWLSCTTSFNKVAIKATESDVTTERTAEVVIYLPSYNLSQTINVTQEKLIFEIEDVATYYEYKYNESEEFTIPVTANFSYDITSSANWVTCTKVANGVRVSVVTNAYTENRVAEIKIYSKKYNLEGKTITISQSASPEIIGSIVTKNGSKGVIYYQRNGVTKIISVREAETKWATSIYIVPELDYYDSTKNMATIKNISGWETRFPAFKWCDAHGEGWLLPTGDELIDLIQNYDLINSTLKANGYVTISLCEDWYWTSATTEYDPSYGYAKPYLQKGQSSSASYQVTFNDKVRAIYVY